jgi:hypothetical protein
MTLTPKRITQMGNALVINGDMRGVTTDEFRALLDIAVEARKVLDYDDKFSHRFKGLRKAFGEDE